MFIENEDMQISATESITTQQIHHILFIIHTSSSTPHPHPSTQDVAGVFVLCADHAFVRRGVGGVVTGTVRRGAVNVGDVIQCPELGVERKVKSIQVFGKDVKRAVKGDR